MREEIKNRIFELINEGNYHDAIELFANQIGLKMTITNVRLGKMTWDNANNRDRYIFKVKLKRKGKQYTFDFGQSYQAGCSSPNMYDVLSCLIKSDPGTYDEFCDNYGYDGFDYQKGKTYKKYNQIYLNVLKEYNSIRKLLPENEIFEIFELL